jgi:TonB-dependent receptor
MLSIKNKTKFIISTIILFLLIEIAAAQNGILTGKIVDECTGEPMIGARVLIKEKSIGSITKINGDFRIQNIPPGLYTVVVTYIGYTTIEFPDVKIAEDQVKNIDFTMTEKNIVKDEVVVSAKAIRTTEAALLKERQKAEAVSDAIGAEEISRGGSSDAADAIKKVTGATTTDGKYVYIRGLGERYSSTELNGSLLPSSDPDKKAVQFDLFPASLIENIVTTKTATPDKPGDFTGGSVNISTKSFPDDFKFSLSMSSSYNTYSSGNPNYLLYQGGSMDWLGMDDGSRSLPSILKNADIPDISMSQSKSRPEQVANAQKLDKYSKAFNSEMAPSTGTAPMNHGLSLSLGDNLFDNRLGYLATMSYARSFSFYDNGINGRYKQTGHDSTVNSLVEDYRLHDTKGSDNVLWGGLVNLAYNMSEYNRIDFKFMYNHSGENTTRYQIGDYDYYGKDQTFESRVLKFTERDLCSYQLSGIHIIPELTDLKTDWQLSLNNSAQDEPDLRFFTNDFTLEDKNEPNSDTLEYQIDKSLYKSPYRYFRNLNEDMLNFNLNFELPFDKSLDIPFKFKTGLSYTSTQRAFSENIYQIVQGSGFQYNGEPIGFFSEENAGIVDSSGNFYEFGNYVTHFNPNATSYDGKSNIGGAYVMIDWFVINDLRLVGGFRYEYTDLEVTGRDTNKLLSDRQAVINEEDILPSMNLVYSLSSKMNIRAAYSKTLARPTFRELAPYSSFDFVGGYIFLGNINLRRTLIDNYDLRWEMFTNPGEIIAASVFYKDFKNPQERVIIGNNGEIQYQNVDNAMVIGAEFELRKNLEFIDSYLNNLIIGMNLTLVKSEVDIAGDELVYIEDLHNNPETTRDFQGQSPYIINFNLAYVNDDWGTDASIYYNIFGKRLSEIGPNGAPNVYELARPELNLILSQKFFDGFKIKLSAKNLLDSDYYKAQTYNDVNYIVQRYSLGRTFSISLSYDIN